MFNREKKKTRTGRLDYHSVGYALASHPKTHSQKKNTPKADGQMGGSKNLPQIDVKTSSLFLI